jgi:hypothetical protein
LLEPIEIPGVARAAQVGFLVFCLLPQLTSAQQSVDVAFLEQVPTIDGMIDESEWAGAGLIDQAFVQFAPDFGIESPYRTVVRVGQTETALYIAFESFDPDPSRLAAAIVSRDGRLQADDSVTVALDSFGDDRTAYAFRTNALATQEDSRVADNGRVVDRQWDAAWLSAATRGEDRWTAEFEIPFSVLRYSSESDVTWGVNFIRTTPRRLETSLWSGPGETIWRVTSFGELNGVDVSLSPEVANQWDVIPYALAAVEADKDPDYEAGLDVRWRPSSRLGVDLTINPDFALIEADVEEINLTRFELRVPEKRPFFLEGSEMFNQRFRQFYSRRIGDITWGAKASGKLGDTDFSAIVTSEDRVPEDDLGDATADYAVVRLQHGLARGSTIGLLAANRDFQGENAGSVGLDTTAYFTDTVSMTGQLLRVHGPTADGGLAWFLRPSWDTSTSHFHVRYGSIDENVKEDVNAVGFFTDDDRKTFDTNATHTFWLDDGPIENVRPRVNYNRYRSQEGVLRSTVLSANVDVIFRNGWEVALQYRDEFKLFEKEFDNDRTVLTVTWDGRDGRKISAYAGGGYNFDNDLTLYGATVEWPFGDRWRFSYDLTRLELEPDLENESTTIHVLEVLYSFNPDLFLKLFVQTNSAIDKENVQAQWVWRFKPPFGSLQIAYQRGTSEQGQESEQGDTFFTKFSWVF